jgi:hypothetical protein
MFSFSFFFVLLRATIDKEEAKRLVITKTPRPGKTLATSSPKTKSHSSHVYLLTLPLKGRGIR